MTPDSVGGRTVADKLRRSLWRLTAATVLLYLVLAGCGIKVYLDQRNTNESLCTLRGDLRTRVDASIQFLKDHPDGIPGVPTKTILDGIQNQRKSIVALSGLNCPED